MPPVLNNVHVQLREDQILKRLSGVEVKPTLNIKNRIEELNAHLGSLINPSVAYEILDIVNIEPQAIVLESERIEGSLLPQLFKDCSQVMVAVCTIGPRLEKRVERLVNEGNILNASLLDEIGNAAIDELIEECLKIANERAEKEGLKASGCICPGKEGFTLEEQIKILKLVNAEDLGVTLTSLNMMSPIKSTSVVIGLGENVVHWEMCDYCDMRERCSYRLSPDLS